MKIVNKIREILGTGLRIIATILMIGGGIACLIICIGIVKEVFGQAIAYLSLLIFPVLLAVAPLYALVSWSNWFPIAFVYGLAIVTGILFGLANWLTGEEI